MLQWKSLCTYTLSLSEGRFPGLESLGQIMELQFDSDDQVALQRAIYILISGEDKNACFSILLPTQKSVATVLSILY